VGFELRPSQVLCLLSHTPNPFLLLVIFSGRVWHFCLGLALDHNPPTYGLPPSWDNVCATMSNLLIEMRSHSSQFGWLRITVLPMSTTCVAGIAGMTHHCLIAKILKGTLVCITFAMGKVVVWCLLYHPIWDRVGTLALPFLDNLSRWEEVFWRRQFRKDRQATFK
jgi:hypothetical protein